MKQSFKNSVNVQGIVFNFGSNERNRLQKRTSHAGVNYISGDIVVATDSSLNNTVTVHYTYVPEKNRNGNDNQIYQNLAQLLDDDKTVETVGKDEASKVRISGEYETNDFYSDRNEEFVSAPRVRGSFVHDLFTLNDDADNATFDLDAIITRVTEQEGDDGTYAVLKGYVFNWRKDVMPITLEVHNPRGASYFVDQDVSSKNVLMTEVRGNIVSKTVSSESEEEEGAWSTQKRTVSRAVRYWDVTWSSQEPMEFDDESTVTKAELKQALADRQARLEADKARQDEWRSQHNGGGNSFSSPAPAPKPAKVEEVDEDDDEDEFPF